MSIWHKKIAGVLTTDDHLFQSKPDLTKGRALLRKLYEKQETVDVYQELGGLGSIPDVTLPEIDFWVGDHYLVIDDALSFHRYRLVTFRSPAYQSINDLDLNNYRRYCRQFESECTKSGVRDGIWTNKQAERHFGAAATAGDFFGTGSPGWKLKAFSDFLLDIYATEAGLSLIRLPIYGNLMVGGKLERLDKLLLKGDEQSGKYIAQHITRILAK
ncbi:MAG: hypothetical protein AAGC88_13460 [Bacteroidota bacterium]